MPLTSPYKCLTTVRIHSRGKQEAWQNITQQSIALYNVSCSRTAYCTYVRFCLCSLCHLVQRSLPIPWLSGSGPDCPMCTVPWYLWEPKYHCFLCTNESRSRSLQHCSRHAYPWGIRAPHSSPSFQAWPKSTASSALLQHLKKGMKSQM